MFIVIEHSHLVNKPVRDEQGVSFRVSPKIHQVTFGWVRRGLIGRATREIQTDSPASELQGLEHSGEGARSGSLPLPPAIFLRGPTTTTTTTLGPTPPRSATNRERSDTDTDAEQAACQRLVPSVNDLCSAPVARVLIRRVCRAHRRTLLEDAQGETAECSGTSSHSDSRVLNSCRTPRIAHGNTSTDAL